ncbi:MAG: hypothetical protein Tsb0034_16130 [Ekhidna sp.]
MIQLKNLRKLNKIYWVYGGVLGLLMIAMEIIHYKTTIRDLSMEWFGVMVGVLFLFLGLWLGRNGRPKALSAFKQSDAEKLGLSKRELEVLSLLEQGHSNQEIADKLFVSLNTAKTHISSIYSKLNVKRRTQAVQIAKTLTRRHPPKE